MPRNIEWKARARDFERQRQLARELVGEAPTLLQQVDTFFVVPHGRLKLRKLAAEQGELIRYSRDDHPGPKQSIYQRARTDQPDVMRDLLAQALGVRGEVRKHRWLYLYGQTRIHLDEVEVLGQFLEVEVVLQPGQALAEAERLAHDLRRRLDVADEDLIAQAYVDMLHC